MQITIYSTPTCPWCHKVKDFLAEHDVSFTDVNVAEDREQAKYMIDKTGQMGVPVTIIVDDGNEHIVLGYDEKQLREIIGIA